MVRDEEARVRQELQEEKKKKQIEQKRKEAREKLLEKLFQKKLKKTNDIIAARGKGKGRLVVEGTDALIEKLVEATMHAESMPSGERSRFSSGLANGESRKRELSKDRMAGLHSVLKLMLLS